MAQAIGKITGRSPEPIKREFMKLAEKVTDAELEKRGETALPANGRAPQALASKDKKLQEASEKVARLSRTAEREEAE